MSSQESGSGFSAVIQMKCPKCRKGNLFCHPTSYNFTKLFQMPEKCSHCEQRFEPEPGFYYGAMYINYGFSVLILALCISVLYAAYNFGPFVVLGAYLGILLVSGPWMFRYSRILYLNIFVRYDKSFSTRVENI